MSFNTVVGPILFASSEGKVQVAPFLETKLIGLVVEMVNNFHEIGYITCTDSSHKHELDSVVPGTYEIEFIQYSIYSIK